MFVQLDHAHNDYSCSSYSKSRAMSFNFEPFILINNTELCISVISYQCAMSDLYSYAIEGIAPMISVSFFIYLILYRFIY